jgi:hypothetical protein
MHDQPSDIIDFDAALRARTQRLTKRLLLHTMRIRQGLPEIPRFGEPAAVLAQVDGQLVFVLRPELDDVDVKIAAYAFARRFSRFDRADAVRLSTLRAARRQLESTHPDVNAELTRVTGI